MRWMTIALMAFVIGAWSCRGVGGDGEADTGEDSGFDAQETGADSDPGDGGSNPCEDAAGHCHFVTSDCHSSDDCITPCMFMCGLEAQECDEEAGGCLCFFGACESADGDADSDEG
jgi:hypothetical protein